MNKAIDQTIEQVYRLVEHFGADRVVVENVPYWQSKTCHARLAALPEFVSSVVEETGCGLLLDLSHARIAAREIGIEKEAYLNVMPVRTKCIARPIYSVVGRDAESSLKTPVDERVFDC